MKEKVKITTNPVAWSDKKVTKYQSVAEYQASKNRSIRIIGEPMPTKEKAFDSMLIELDLWGMAIGEINNFISKQDEKEEDNV